MIKEIKAKVLLSSVPQPDPWFGLKYNMNLYRGCQHQCIYCDSRSSCYQIENFSDILIKSNALELLEKELSHKRKKGLIGTGSMNDPYMPLEAKINLTRQALEIIAKYHFPVHIITKSALVTRDLEIIKRIDKINSRVSFSISTADDNLAALVEPGASKPSERFKAMKTINENGITTGVILMPVLPFIEDNQNNILQIVNEAKENGASYVLPSLGVTLRDRQRIYFYEKLDKHFPGIRTQYESHFGNDYFAPANKINILSQFLSKKCREKNIPMHIFSNKPETIIQGSLF
jgi:DNA repair photolyase